MHLSGDDVCCVLCALDKTDQAASIETQDGIHSGTTIELLLAYQRNAIQMAFCWWADSSPRVLAYWKASWFI